ncbi:hypothetical protein ENUP19_0004G0046 [Entamoeba nuttalli]|uniref:Uncharacterized protein n=2 Tax=Entamoeba nuttalli TaxID=412467 RepID=K2H758_ENTNP|nr:hypothetical protein ENU1_169340 [Entamoeba nuttalli P19]EKE38349.1 hypothetical protein ENU1_169340 [Entamoeba nuttalli P19]|eukprot:XP_008859315.1 hypothetical protein ENU1_169340 [Entamoeba nuttalli P19]
MPKQTKQRKVKEKKEEKKPKVITNNSNQTTPSIIPFIPSISEGKLPSVQQLSALKSNLPSSNEQINQVLVSSIPSNSQRVQMTSQQPIQIFPSMVQVKLEPSQIQSLQTQNQHSFIRQQQTSKPQLVNAPQLVTSHQSINRQGFQQQTQTTLPQTIQKIQPNLHTISNQNFQQIQNLSRVNNTQTRPLPQQQNQPIQTGISLQQLRQLQQLQQTQGIIPVTPFITTQNGQLRLDQKVQLFQAITPQGTKQFFVSNGVAQEIVPTQVHSNGQNNLPSIHPQIPTQPITISQANQKQTSNFILSTNGNLSTQKIGYNISKPLNQPITQRNTNQPINIPSSQLTFNLNHPNQQKSSFPQQQQLQTKQEPNQLPQMPQQIQQGFSFKPQPTQVPVSRILQLNSQQLPQQQKGIYVLTPSNLIHPLTTNKINITGLPQQTGQPILTQIQPNVQMKQTITQTPPFIQQKIVPQLIKKPYSKSIKEEDSQSKTGSVGSGGRKKKKENKKIMESPQKPSLIDEHKKEVLKIYENNTQNINGMIKEHPKYPESFEQLLHDIAKYCNANAFFKYDCFEDKIMVSSALSTLYKDPRTILIFKVNSPINDKWGFPKPFFSNDQEFNDEVVISGMSKDHSVEQFLNLFYEFTKTLLNTTEQSVIA